MKNPPNVDWSVFFPRITLYLLTLLQAAFAERAKRLGYETDISSAGALQRSFEAIQDPSARRILEILSTKAMNRAKYFCAGMLDIAKYQHYALNAPLYTHFTSPIRRYADVLVHRQLEAVLSGPGMLLFRSAPNSSSPPDIAAATEPKFTMDRDSVAKVAQQCNMYVQTLTDRYCTNLVPRSQ